MSTAVYLDERLFDGGPPLGLERRLRLTRYGDPRFAKRAVLAAIFAWGPLAVLTVMREFGGGSIAHSFLEDVGTHVRLLIALPLLILSERDTIPRFSRIACHFISSGVVGDEDRPRYSAIVKSTKRVLDSKLVEILMFGLAYVLVIALVLNQQSAWPAWATNSTGPVGLSIAGLWHVFVSLPLLMVLLLGWIWRIFLWWRFTALISRMDLKLIAAHPDKSGGLGFVNDSLRGFRLLAIAIGSITAAAQMNISLQSSEPYFGFRNALIAVLIVILVLATGPLFMFVRNLRAARSVGTFQYGSLARVVGAEFERIWLDPSVKCDPSVMERSDFSAMTDLYQVVGNVYEIRDVPITLRSLTPILVAGAVPFLPVAVMAMPLKELLLGAAKLLL